MHPDSRTDTAERTDTALTSWLPESQLWLTTLTPTTQKGADDMPKVPQGGRAAAIAVAVAATSCLLLSEATGWRTGICCFAAAPLTPGPLPESHRAWARVKDRSGAKAKGPFANWLGYAWDESFKDVKRTDDLLKKRGIPWAVRLFLKGIKGSPRFQVEGDAIVMMTKLNPIGLVVSMRYPPKARAITTTKEINLPNFPVRDTTVTYQRGRSLVTESTTVMLKTNVTHLATSIATLDEATDEIVIKFVPGEKGETPFYQRFRRGKPL